MEQTIFSGAAFVLAAIAVFTDTKRGLIPNWLTMPAIPLGIALHGASAGLDGIIYGAGGAALGLGLFFLPYWLGNMGAGDVKLLAALGAFVGPWQVSTTFVASAMLGGLIGGCLLVRRFGWQGTYMTVASGWGSLVVPASAATRMTGFPFASAIFFGLFASLLVN